MQRDRSNSKSVRMRLAWAMLACAEGGERRVSGAKSSGAPQPLPAALSKLLTSSPCIAEALRASASCIDISRPQAARSGAAMALGTALMNQAAMREASKCSVRLQDEAL